VKLNKSATETLEMLCEAFGEHSLSWKAVFELHSRPVECQLKMTNVQGDQAPAKRQKMLKNRELIHEDCHQTIHELTGTIGISYGDYQETLTENLNMPRIAVKFVPQLLTNNQKQRRVNMCLELQEKANKDPTFISRIIIGDKSWICFPN
jgi:hypothetical protein